MKAGVATAMLLLIQGVAGQTCGLAASTLSTSCDDACSQYEPVWSYESSREKERAESSESSLQQQVEAIPDETDTYAAGSNDAVSNISTIELQPTVTSFVLVGGSSVNSSVKSKVAKVAFASDVISTQSNVTNVVMNNLDLSTPATLQQLPAVLPTSLQKLSLANTLLSAFPTLVANFTSLQNLDLDKNYITEIAATAALNSLIHLSTAYSLWNDEELLSLQVKYEEIEDIGTIGSGAFGVVWLVKYRGSQLLASKRLRSDHVTKQRTQAFIEEIKMVAPLDHPNVVRLVGCAWTIESDLQALFEYMENGDLRDYLVDPNSPRHWSQELLQLAADIIEALVYVHSFTPPLVHRDLKSRNVLLTGDMKAKVTDFGASRYKSVDETMTAAVGTGRWLAPEVISGSSKYDQSVDVFSFGVVLSEMDTHSIPYEDVRGANGNRLNDIAILQLVATGQLRPRFGASCPPELRMLAERCLDQDPENRPPAHVVAYELRVIQRSHYTLL
ncbi:UPF0489 protein C5orf22 [Phytophthora nicotianae]|uniref:UPF0489 protein C5orf22 n=1 Tax=Phytophthora nicotianae TaxID=4792 RepID=A0A0W8CZM9_PHYNI|nr:UPF0489 protein C5orf22 [Phytophthora nicotianae]